MTFGEALAAKWVVRQKCKRCGVVLRVNLPVVIAALGAEAIPWGRSPPCPVVSDNRFPCDGRMYYLARATRHGSWSSMAMPPGQMELDLWRARTSGRSYDEVRAERETSYREQRSPAAKPPAA